MRTTLLALASLFTCACGAAPAHVDDAARNDAALDAPAVLDDGARHDAELAVAAVLDDWHAAAAAADEERYFGHLADDAVFLGTDATERWTKPEFRAYAHPHFSRGRAWTFHAVRRHIAIDPEGRYAWFDEALATESLGPARGSGLLRLEDGRWRIVHYDLSLTIPNERFAEVHALLSAPPSTIEGTTIAATPANRAVIATIERYRAALIARDRDALFAVVSPRYHDDSGTPVPDDDLDSDAVRTHLDALLADLGEVSFTIQYRELRREGERVLVEVSYDATFVVHGDEQRHSDEVVYVLERDSTGYRFVSGL